ncbi:hypothetical protein [Conexibacter sp. CPCC 206217]|uniref:hypothetical protein n=1 Tax=Conexibacter sp. CPCC 206217 TaxID=3064574 RepID=UPI002716F8E9|nr:hypothetical protein [Conexibacter sp. CPCC 206217]MDO8212386.1 hypothetical protein [Conexibacter sp. CPCC 206217]
MDRIGNSATASRPTLRALPGGLYDAAADGRDGQRGGRTNGHAMASAPGECAVSRGAVRAGERNEPWTLAASLPLRRLAGAAYAIGIDLELALRIALESELACRDLRDAGVDPALLDAAAAAQRVDGQLDAAASAYLRRLTHERDSPRRDVDDAVTVGLPARLSARLLRADLDHLLSTADIARAIRWETAAVLTGRTISEWAPLAALRLAAPAPPSPAAA